VASLNFQIDRSMLAFNTLCSYTKDYSKSDNCKSVEIFLQRARQFNPDTCDLIEYTLCQRSFLLQYGPSKKSATDLTGSLEMLAAKLKDDPSFTAILQETEQARFKLEQEWAANAENTNKIMADLTGLPLDQHFDVYILHPCLKHNTARSDHSICCTYRQRYPNYNTQNLWYIIMSALLETEDRDSTKGRAVHAVLDLLFLELKNRLSEHPTQPKGEGDYNHLLESWQLYLKQDGKRDIYKYIDTASQVLESRAH
jgi:hypothetical protein